MLPKYVSEASTSFSDIDLVECVAFDGINYVLADTGVFRCKHYCVHLNYRALLRDKHL